MVSNYAKSEMNVLLEYNYWWFTGISHKGITIVINVLYICFVMPALRLMFLITHNAQNNAGIIGGFLHMFIAVCSALTPQRFQV